MDGEREEMGFWKFEIRGASHGSDGSVDPM